MKDKIKTKYGENNRTKKTTKKCRQNRYRIIYGKVNEKVKEYVIKCYIFFCKEVRKTKRIWKYFSLLKRSKIN